MTIDQKKIKEDFEDLKNDLNKPENISNPAKLKGLSQKYNQLEKIVKIINELEILENKIAGLKKETAEEIEPELATIAQQELDDLIKEKEDKEKELEEELKPKDPLDEKNIIVEIRAGAGGDEAALFAANLFRMYSRYAESKNWKSKILSSNRIGVGGFKEVIFEISGINVYSRLKYESGVHRVQRIPETEKSGRIHTSTVTVAVLPEAEEVDLEIKPENLKIDVFRAGGHGGQSVNTTDSAVRITHLPTNIVVNCQDERSQLQNKIKAMQILRTRLLAAKQEKIAKERGETRRLQIGTGDRAEKIRTYNFPQSRVTDHRLKESWRNISAIIDGELDPIIEALKKADSPK